MIDANTMPKHVPVIGETTRTPIKFLLELKPVTLKYFGFTYLNGSAKIG